MQDFIKNLPKAELHVHIEGTFEPELKFKIANRNNIQLPYKTVEECIAGYNFYDLPSFLKIYYEAMKVLLHKQDFYDLTCAYLKRAAQDNVRYAEIFFDPQAHTSRGVNFSVVIEGILSGIDQAKSEYNINANVIMCFLRDLSADSAMETLEQSMPYKDKIIGVGLDSDEKNNPPIKFKEVFKRAREEGYKLTMH